jgi:ribosomal protein S18 acetylase RimI-like enzyme
MPVMPIEIRPAELPRDLPEVRALFRQYAASLDIDLEFQGFEAELASLPGKYAPPSGRLLLAWDTGSGEADAPDKAARARILSRRGDELEDATDPGCGDGDEADDRGIDGRAVGCVALRPIGRGTCEMKRLFVRPEARGARLGRRLAECICREARAAGYARICLDTLPTMTSAIELYRSLGFQPVEPYAFNPVPGARFLALDL